MASAPFRDLRLRIRRRIRSPDTGRFSPKPTKRLTTATICPIACLFHRRAPHLDWMTMHILFWFGAGDWRWHWRLAAPAALAAHEELSSAGGRRLLDLRAATDDAQAAEEGEGRSAAIVGLSSHSGARGERASVRRKDRGYLGATSDDCYCSFRMRGLRMSATLSLLNGFSIRGASANRGGNAQSS